MTKLSKSAEDFLDEFTGRFERQEAAESRLAEAATEAELAYALVIAALSWQDVDPRGWRTPAELCAQARRLMALGRVPAAAVDDEDAVQAALLWTVEPPALLERDAADRYRSVIGVVFAVGAEHWHQSYLDAAAGDRLTPLELVHQGDLDHYRTPADLTAAEVAYRRAINADDPDAAAIAGLRLAELTEATEPTDGTEAEGTEAIEPGDSAEAARRYAQVAALQHPVASPPAQLWLARRAARDGDRDTARALAEQVVAAGATGSQVDALGLLGSLAWLDENLDEAVALMRRAVEAAGPLHSGFTESLAAMLAAQGDVAQAADVCRRLVEDPFGRRRGADQYLRLMASIGRVDEAVAVLEEQLDQHSPFDEHLLLALLSAHGLRDDPEAMRHALARLRAHHFARRPDVAVRADIAEAGLAVVDGEDARAAELYRVLTDSDDTHRRSLARPQLLAWGEQMAVDGKICAIPGVRPLLEYLSEAAPPATATWAATSLAHLATMEGRADDAEVAVRLAARHQPPHESIMLRASLLRRAGRADDAMAYLLDACQAAAPEDLAPLLEMFSQPGWRRVRADGPQRARLRGTVDHAIFSGDAPRPGLAAAMALVEQYVFQDWNRARGLWELATDVDDPPTAARAWLHVGFLEQWHHPVAAVGAYEQAARTGAPDIAESAAVQLVWLGRRLGDDGVVARASEILLDLTDGEDWAQAALRLGQAIASEHPDDAEEAYHAAIADPDASPATIGAALAHLGALYAAHGNRRLAQHFWRRGKRHRSPDVAEAFTAARTAIGRVNRIPR